MAWISRARLALAGALAASALAAGTAHAATPIPKEGLTLQEMQAWLQGLGLPVTVNTEHGFLTAQVNVQGLGLQTIAIFPSDCANDHCRSLIYFYGISYTGGIRPDDASAAVLMNGWNIKYRWARAFVNEDRNPAIAMDFATSPGIDTDGLTSSLIVFVESMPLFRQYLYQSSQPQQKQ
jgi:hypothetical protein